MRTTRAIGVATAVIGVLAASGCSGSGEKAASTSTSPKSTVSSTSTPSKTSTSSAPTPTTNSTEAGAPGVPKAARQHTKAGAEAFSRYYIQVINDTATHPKTGVLEPLALDECKTCDNHEKEVQKLVSKDERFSTREMDVKSAAVVGADESLTRVEVHGYLPAVKVVDSNGTTTNSFPEDPDQGLMFELSWLDSKGWRVAHVKTIAD